MDETVNVEDVLAIVAEQKWMLIILLIVFLVFMALFTRSMKKRSRQSKERLHKELSEYMQMGQPETYVPSGSVSVAYDSVTYTRGNRGAVFEIPIEKETVLAPFMIDEWFVGRNYSGREAQKILEDIKRYLITNNICKKVTIVSDEEYDAAEEAEEDLETE